jgi:hypothetical protein
MENVLRHVPRLRLSHRASDERSAVLRQLVEWLWLPLPYALSPNPRAVPAAKGRRLQILTLHICVSRYVTFVY